jgi:predicted DNA-binding transcriptional regulator AlpA
MQPSFTVPEWCAHRKVSRSMFYKMASEGWAPRTYNVGVSRRISPEADAEWLRQREAESAHETAAA